MNITSYNSAGHNSTNNVPAVPVVNNNVRKLPISTVPLHSIIKSKQYIVIPNCLLEHLITNDVSTGTSTLSPLEKLYFLLACSLSIINYNNNNGYATDITAKSWAAILGCSKSQVFYMQSRLEKLGYFIILRDKNEQGQNNRNIITPTLPDNIFKLLCNSPENQYNLYTQLAYSSDEPKLAYLSRIKQYIPISYRLLKTLTADKSLSNTTKLIYLDCLASNHKYQQESKSDYNYNEYNYSCDESNEEEYFFTNYQDLAKRYGTTTNYVSAIYNKLSNRGMITKESIKSRCIKSLGNRQDRSLWKISMIVPEDYAIEILKTKDRNSHSLTETNYSNPVSANRTALNKTIEQEPSIIVDAVIDKLTAMGGDIPNLTNTNKLENIKISSKDTTNSNNFLQNDSNHSHNSNSVSEKPQQPSTPHVNRDSKSASRCIDPQIVQFGQYYNKDILLKKYISNLRGNSKVIFYDFLINLGLNSFVPKKYIERDRNKKVVGKKKVSGVGGDSGSNKPEELFSITRELIRAKIKLLPKDKAGKARKFAYSIHSKGLATGYAASLSKHELAKQLIFHASTWKPTKLGNVSREQEIDTALSMAWKAIVNGTWQSPLEWAKADIIQHEYSYYRKKYQESGVLSPEVKTLEVEVDKILGGYSDLTGKIIGHSLTKNRESSTHVQPFVHINRDTTILVKNKVSENKLDMERITSSAQDQCNYREEEFKSSNQNTQKTKVINVKDQISEIRSLLNKKNEMMSSDIQETNPSVGHRHISYILSKMVGAE